MNLRHRILFFFFPVRCLDKIKMNKLLAVACCCHLLSSIKLNTIVHENNTPSPTTVVMEVPKGSCYDQLGSLEVDLFPPAYWSNYVNCISPGFSLRGESLLLPHRDDEAFVNGQHYKVQKLGELSGLRLYVVLLPLNFTIDWKDKTHSSTRACMSIHWFPLAPKISIFSSLSYNDLGKSVYTCIPQQVFTPELQSMKVLGYKYHVNGIYVV